MRASACSVSVWSRLSSPSVRFRWVLQEVDKHLGNDLHLTTANTISNNATDNCSVSRLVDCKCRRHNSVHANEKSSYTSRDGSWQRGWILRLKKAHQNDEWGLQLRCTTKDASGHEHLCLQGQPVLVLQQGEDVLHDVDVDEIHAKGQDDAKRQHRMSLTDTNE